MLTMRWEAITQDNAVARLSVASEQATFDLKARYDTKADPTKSFEIAKDICAFANHLGGTILVGAHEAKGGQRGRIAKFEPLTEPSPGELVTEVTRVIGLYCRPVPIVVPIPISLDDAQVSEILSRPDKATVVVAINVP